MASPPSTQPRVDLAFAEHRCEVLGAPDPIAAIQQVHWQIHRAFVAYQAVAEERRQLAADTGELIRQLVHSLLAVGWTEEQARTTNVRELASDNRATHREELRMGTTLVPPFVTAGDRQDQAMAALAQANRVRLRRASLMRWMHGRSAAESHQKAAELILEPDPIAATRCSYSSSSSASARSGQHRQNGLLELADVSPTSTIGALTARQRAGLAALLRLRADQLSSHNRRKTA